MHTFTLGLNFIRRQQEELQRKKLYHHNFWDCTEEHLKQNYQMIEACE